jgi:hypothetical protein
MNTLFADDTNDKTCIGKGLFVTQIKKDLLIYNQQGFVEKKSMNDNFEKRLAAVELVRNHGAMKSRLVEFLEGLSTRQTLDNWLAAYDKYGAKGLINNTKDSWKKNPKRFKGNKAREFEQDRKEAKAATQAQQVQLNFTPSGKQASSSGVESRQQDRGSAQANTGLFEEVHNFEANRHAGTMLITALAQHLYNLSDTVSDVYGEASYFFYLMLAMHANQIASVEQLKVVKKRDFGLVTGKSKLESLPKLWEQLHRVVDQGSAASLKERILDNQALQGITGLDQLSLDGHFVPYYGKEKTHKGYFTQRNLMMKGQTQMFVHDSIGRVVYFETGEGKGDIVSTLKTASDYIGDLNEGAKPLIAVDREAWGVENLKCLKDERIVTWEKFSKQEELQKIDKEAFEEEFDYNGKTWLLHETTKGYGSKTSDSISLRRLVLHNKETAHRLAMVATDFKTDKVVVSKCMLNRWASNENTFKYTGGRTNMHYNPVMEISQQSSKQETDNPEYKELQKQLKTDKKTLDKHEKQLGRKPFSTNQDGSLRKNKHREELRAKCREVEERIRQTNEVLANTPQRIDCRELGREAYKTIATEGFNLWTLAQTVFWNTRKALHQKFYEFLPNERDTLPVLESLINAPGKIKATKQMLHIKLELQETPRFRSAQIQLIRYINNLNISLNGKLVQFDKMSNSD